MQNSIQIKDTSTRVVDRNSFYAKDNDMISKLAEFELSELRLIAFILAHYDSRKSENLAFLASISDLMRVFPLSQKSAYNVVKEAVKGINSKPLELNSDSEDEVVYWFRGLRHIKGRGQFVFKINPDIEQYFLGLKGNFTKIRIEDVYHFKAKTTWILYENLKMHSRPGKEIVRSYEVDELRNVFGVKEGQYETWFDFRKRCLDCSVKEINGFSDLDVKATPKRRGRHIARVEFIINVKNKRGERLEMCLDPRAELCRVLVAQGLTADKADVLSKLAEEQGRIEFIHLKMVEVQNRYSELPKSKKKSYQLYLEAALRGELGDKTQALKKVDNEFEYSESLECLKAKGKGNCRVRKRGAPGSRKKCIVCFDKLPIDSFGV